MKSNVDFYTDALVRAISDSDAYIAFENVKKKIEKRPELIKQINEFRLNVYSLQNDSDTDQLYEKMEKLYVDTAAFREDNLVEEYLSCELAVCRMLQKIFRTLVGSVDLQIDDIAEQISFKRG